MAVSGNYLGLYVNGQRIALTKSNDFASKMAMIDITTKDSSGNKEVQPGLKEGSCSMEGICTSGLTIYYNGLRLLIMLFGQKAEQVQ